MKKEKIEKWILKAENDLKIAKDEILTENPATDAICFHAQQCVEKYLKAYLSFIEKPFGKTHDIALLIELCIEDNKEFNFLYDMMANKLTRYAVEIRYPNDFYFPSLEEAKEAIEICEKVKQFIINKVITQNNPPML
jgi:HEPN domain-containing protein